MFVTLIAGFLVLGVALAVDIAYEPPLWVYLVIFLPLPCWSASACCAR